MPASGSAILDTDGVEDYEGLTVNGGTANLTVPAKHARGAGGGVCLLC